MKAFPLRLRASIAVCAIALLSLLTAIQNPSLASSEVSYVAEPLKETPSAVVANAIVAVAAEPVEAANAPANEQSQFSQKASTQENAMPAQQTLARELTAISKLTVAAGQQPAMLLALSGAGGVPFTNLTLTAGDSDVHVSTLTIQRTGPGQDRIFDDVAMTDEAGGDLGDGSFNSSHQVILSEPFTVAARTSKTLYITADMSADLADFEGQMPTLSVVRIEADAPVEGLPITGTPQTVNSTLEIGEGSAALGMYDPGVDGTRYIGDNGVRFAGIRISANSKEDLRLDSITWRQNGSASASDVANIATIVGGNSYPAEESGREYTSVFNPAITIAKGQSIEVYLQGDILTSGSNRTLKFDIDSSDGISLTGKTYGYGVGIIAEGNTAISGNSVFITSDGTTDGDEAAPFYSAPLITIRGATPVSVDKAN